MRVIECEGVQIAASVETCDSEEHSAYYPSNILFYVEQGQLNLKMDQELFSIQEGKFGVVRKYTTGSYFKTWSKNVNGAIVYVFLLQDNFIHTALQEFVPHTKDFPVIENRILLLEPNHILKGLFKGLISYINENETIDKQLLVLKTKEALLGILKNHPEYISIFTQFSKSERADLEAFMNYNYTFNVSLERLAKMSGRSLSTFNREFKTLFNDSPHRWITKKRLNKAKELLLSTSKRSSDIYLDLGFEDLAHFSRSFKKEFGKTPTEIKKTII